MSNKPRVLISAFDPYAGEQTNISETVLKEFLPEDNIQLKKLFLPTVFGKSSAMLLKAIDEFNPDLTLCLGQVLSRSRFSIEKVAINLDDARIKDNEGNRPQSSRIIKGAPDGFFSNLPVNNILTQLQEEDIGCEISYAAGTFVCNHVFYNLMHHIWETESKMKGGFIHLPGRLQPSDRIPLDRNARLQKLLRAVEITVQLSLSQ
jgi:pyroglutamyl-peptidase